MLYVYVCLYGIILLPILVNCSKDWSSDVQPQKWNKIAKEKIDQILNRKLNGNIAKNVILFLGDGMGITTVTAGRIRKGQLKNNNGEEEITFMESLPHVALSKTYNIDAQTADSAGTATAYLTGVKTRFGAIGVDGRAHDCPTSLKSKTESILKWAHFAGKSTGIITTTRITHASPAATYANSFDRDMESFDGINFKQEHLNQGCKDIAAQLIEENSFINLILAGGRKKFLSNNHKDYGSSFKGDRIDGRNLIEEWQTKMEKQMLKHKFLWNISDFHDLKPNQYMHILGLLNYDHMDYETDRINKIPVEEPSIIDMTAKAIEILSSNPRGFFLMVEGGKIDHGHHSSNAQLALNDFVVFDEAVGQALQLTSSDDTLITVTADHSHVFTMGGYAIRGNPILGINLNHVSNVSKLNLTYTSLLYGNGPGGINPDSLRNTNLTNIDTEHKDYIQESAIYLNSETHGGEDVAIYASGPMSFLFDGTVEQNYIAHVMAYTLARITKQHIQNVIENVEFLCNLQPTTVHLHISFY
ncbi:alkaline tissue-nonspecific isozyme [Brachionus plicatilis]|uniref:Alkaline phosphatase, tissue-nonspecific isozyme n=1 Tax=Brachionus plicatilis TaxID=10195 RepID=A0A3M7T1P1_BRAPC|nr:alkaline tissue-nonspecific isozyme [Brachionus plicatilis]